MTFDIVGNTSIGSNRFMGNASQGGGFVDSPTTIRDNQIYATTQTAAIYMVGGQFAAIDNTIASLPGATGPVITWAGSAEYLPDEMFIGNTFTVPSWGEQPYQTQTQTSG